MNRAVSQVIDDLNKGILPLELDFTDKPQDPIDWAKVKYNTFRDPEYYSSKYNGLSYLPNFDEMCYSIARNAPTPSELMDARANIINTKCSSIDDETAGDVETTAVAQLDQSILFDKCESS
jgi:hypothetical protein